MRLKKFLNTISGMIVGAVTGCFAWPLQILFVYYLFVKQMRLAGYSWPTTLLATLTVGHFGAIIAGFVTLIYALAAPVYGLTVGYKEGLRGALLLLFRLPQEIYKYLVFFSINADREWSRGLFNFASQCFMCGGFSFIKVIVNSLDPEGNKEIEDGYAQYKIKEILRDLHSILEQLRSPTVTLEQSQALYAQYHQKWHIAAHLLDSMALRQGRALPAQENAQLAINARLVDHIQGLSTEDLASFPTLTPDEMADFRKAIDAETEAPVRQKNERLYQYLTSRCLLSLDTLAELSQAKDAGGAALLPPITVEGHYPEEKGGGRHYLRTYDYANFLTYLEVEKDKEVEKNKTRPIAVVGGSANNGDCLEDSQHVKIYRGFYPIDAEYIRGEIARWKTKSADQRSQEPQALSRLSRLFLKFNIPAAPQCKVSASPGFFSAALTPASSPAAPPVIPPAHSKRVAIKKHSMQVMSSRHVSSRDPAPSNKTR